MNKLIRAIIIDDETRARTLLRGMIQEYISNLEIIGDYGDLPSAVKAIRKLKPDLVFLDIEMPGHSGLEIHDFFGKDEIDFDIIFTTAYSEYALQAFKLSAVDYLLKPIDATELELAIERYQNQVSRQKSDLIMLQENLKRNITGKIAVPTSAGAKLIKLDDINYLKADSSYTEIKLIDKSVLIASRTLKNFEEAIGNGSDFFRCHKSYIINLKHITEYVRADGGYLVTSSGESIPLSPERTTDFMERINMVKR
jgi:two-component system LytT family response regulator